MILKAKWGALLGGVESSLHGMPRWELKLAAVALSGILIYLDWITGPRVSFGVFYLITLYLVIKYIGLRFSYLLVGCIAIFKTVIKYHPHMSESQWWELPWQFFSSISIYALFCYLMDAQLSGRKQAEAALGDLRQLSEAIIGNTDSGILFFGPNGQCVIANQAAANILNRTRQQLLEFNFMNDEQWPFPALLEAGREVAHSDMPRRFTARLAVNPDREVWCATSVGRIHQGGESYLLMVFTDVSAYRAIEDAKLRASRAAARAELAERKLISIGEEMQQRLGRELHDDLGQRLMGAAFLSEVLFQKLKDAGRPEMQDASKITSVLNASMDRTRQLAQGLYPVELQEQGLSRMLEHFAGHVESMCRVTFEFSDQGGCGPIDPDVSIHLFRIVQEAVNNAVRHGQAESITLRLVYARDALMLEVQDDGCGLGNADLSSRGGGIGMRSMRSRAELMGATLQIGNLPQGGVRVALSLPIGTGQGS